MHSIVLMQGLKPVNDFSMQQVEAMAGMETLCTQTMAFGLVGNAKTLARGRARLAAALTKVESPALTLSPHLTPLLPFLHARMHARTHTHRPGLVWSGLGSF